MHHRIIWGMSGKGRDATGGQVTDIDPQVYVLVHQGDKPMEDAYNFDPWNNYEN